MGPQPTPGWGEQWRCPPVQREQLAVTVEGVAAEVDELQLAERGQGGYGLQLVLLQVQAPQPWPQTQKGPGRNLRGDAKRWCELLPGLSHPKAWEVDPCSPSRREAESPRWPREKGQCRDGNPGWSDPKAPALCASPNVHGSFYT